MTKSRYYHHLRLAAIRRFAESSDMEKIVKLNNLIQSGKLSPEKMQKASQLMFLLTQKMAQQAGKEVAAAFVSARR